MSLFAKKRGVNLNDLMELHKDMFGLFYAFVMYCSYKSLPCKITSIKDLATGRVSTTHETGRAVDISTRGWSVDDIDDALIHFNRGYENIGAISFRDGVSRALVYHRVKGSRYHFHLQVRP